VSSASAHSTPFRIGHGYDLHRLEPPPPEGQGRPFILGGLRLEHPVGPVGHSDGDALFHAVTDAILGALAMPDIGQLFPDTAPENDGRSSDVFLIEAVRRARDAGWRVGNCDCTIILERPKIGPIKDQLRRAIAGHLDIELGQVNVKGKTHEGIGDLGAGRAVEVHVVATLFPAGEGAST
jgi:2-C-methyl-D-erythritol 2,4-cyclodiphosphate synthase